MLAPLRVYIAAPYTADTSEQVEANVAAAIQAGNEVLAAGHAPFVPHLAHYWHTEHAEHPYEAWMRLDLSWLEAADVLIRLPGSSHGADRETAKARRRGIAVFDSVAEFLDRHGRRD